MAARDTTPEAAAVQREAYRRAGPAGRLRIAMELSDLVREFARAGVRMRHPEYTPEDISKELLWQIYGLRPDPRAD
ncbi:MAG: hypothetical protein QOK37_934 [Thermoanaerobaculia bacterium]|jgi:hypothetical protein|nr:hypothetical protein [Thermoanaerobaculia bacterium]